VWGGGWRGVARGRGDTGSEIKARERERALVLTRRGASRSGWA
jgi:hypothetical protein